MCFRPIWAASSTVIERDEVQPHGGGKTFLSHFFRTFLDALAIRKDSNCLLCLCPRLRFVESLDSVIGIQFFCIGILLPATIGAITCQGLVSPVHAYR